MTRSDKLRRFEYSTTATSAAKHAQRTELKAQGLTHMQAAMRVSEHFGIKRGRQAVESLCHLRGIPSVHIKKPRGTDIGARPRRKRSAAE